MGKLPDPKEVIDQHRETRAPRTKLGQWYVTLDQKEKDWFWSLMEQAFFEGEYGAVSAIELARPHLDGIPSMSDNAAKKFLDEYRPS